MLLCAVVFLAYLPSLGGGFLNWDDPWLLESNALLSRPSWHALWRIWTDFSLDTRAMLGAEYLPLRDTSHLVESWLFGLRAAPLRLVNLALYEATILVVWQLMRCQLRHEVAALVATAAFALHPVHVESVAWLAGRKDVLAMLFGVLALRSYVRRGPGTVLVTAGWFALAVLAKSMSVALPLLLPLFDLWAWRRPNYRAIAASLLAVMMLLPLHLFVGNIVGMTQPLAGGSLSTALATMGPVWLRYVEVLVWPWHCSIVHEVPTLTRWTPVSVLAYLALAIALTAACVLLRQRRTIAFAALGFFLVPLLPVSQVIAPLQNRMADRYLWFSVLALSAPLASLSLRSPKFGGTLTLALLVFWTTVTAERATLFGDSSLVFADATRKTTQSGIAPYQLAMALEGEGQADRAREAYEEVWRRTAGNDGTARRATNNLARLEVRAGNLERAEQVLLRGLVKFPGDTKMRENLRKVSAMRKQDAT